MTFMDNVNLELKSYPADQFNLIAWKREWVENWKLIKHLFPETSVDQFLQKRQNNFLFNPQHNDHNGKSIIYVMMIQPSKPEEKLGRKINSAKLAKYMKNKEKNIQEEEI